jgi:hypothetical protein
MRFRAASFDYLVGACKHCLRDVKAERLGLDAVLGYPSRAAPNTFFRLFGLPIVIVRETQHCVFGCLVPHLLREIAYFRGALAPSLRISRSPCHGTKA